MILSARNVATRGRRRLSGSYVLTTLVGAVSAAVGVLAGGVFTKWAQDRHWLREQELGAYREVLGHYARFAMEISRANQDKRGWDYDWGGWSAALLSASLLAPDDVAGRLDDFGRAVQVLLDATAASNSIDDPLTLEQLRQAMQPAAQAQVALVNAMRRSLGRRTRLSVPFGGTPVGPPSSAHPN
jgi:hypothetical protein